MSKKTKKKDPALAPLKLDLGCGRNKLEGGWTGVDFYAPDADVKLDLFKSPWPWKDGTVDEIHASHFLEHVPQALRWPFMEECWRVLKPESTMRVIVPNWKSERAYGDMTHQWPPVASFFFQYLNRSWRESNKLTYGAYALKCNFDFQGGVIGVSPDIAARNQEAQQFAWAHYLESFSDMWVTLTKRA